MCRRILVVHLEARNRPEQPHNPGEHLLKIDVFYLLFCACLCVCVQLESDEKTLRKEISYAIKNIHGIR